MCKVLRVVALFAVVSVAADAFARTASFAEFDVRAKAGERLNVVYFGASLMYSANASDPPTTGFRGLMSEYLEKRYPRAHFRFHDAAIGGTPSKLGLLRLKRDVLDRNPDLVFLDFVCNDGGDNVNPDNTCAYEQILRTLIGAGVAVEQVFFTFRWWMDGDDYDRNVPRQRLYRNLAESYQTPYSDTQCLIRAKLRNGETTLERIWPIDGGHPTDYGYSLFFEAAKDAFEKAVEMKTVCRVCGDPVYGSVEDVRRQHLSTLYENLPAGWTVDKTFRTSMWFDGLSSRWLGDTVVRIAGGAPAVTAVFRGNWFAFFGEADGKTALPLEITVDRGEPGEMKFDHGCDGRLVVFRDRFIGDWMTGTAEEHSLVFRPSSVGECPEGEVRVESLMSATFRPTSRTRELLRRFGQREFDLDAIDHVRGIK